MLQENKHCSCGSSGRTGRNVCKSKESIGSENMKSIFSVPQN